MYSIVLDLQCSQMIHRTAIEIIIIIIFFTQSFKRDTQLADNLFYLMAICNI